MEYILKRSRRKTLSIAVERDLQLMVRAPLRMPRAEIERFLAGNTQWIAKQRERLREGAERRAAFRYADGDVVLVEGEEKIIATRSLRHAVLEGERLLLPPENRVEALVAFLRERARARTALQISHFAPRMGVSPAAVHITSATTRWGSCSGRNSLSFSWRVACLPPALLDYIVVHELAHIREHNHSAQFWAVVGSIMPDYAQRRVDLRAFQQFIVF